MKHQYEYANKRIVLKPLEAKDIEDLRNLRNRNKKFFATKAEITKEGQKDWYQSYLQKDNDIMFKVVLGEKPEQFIGAVAVYDIDRKARTCEFGRIVIDKEKTDEKGIGTETVEGICRFAFLELNMKKIKAEVLKENARAIAVYKKTGFKVTKETENMYTMVLSHEFITGSKQNA